MLDADGVAHLYLLEGGLRQVISLFIDFYFIDYVIMRSESVTRWQPRLLLVDLAVGVDEVSAVEGHLLFKIASGHALGKADARSLGRRSLWIQLWVKWPRFQIGVRLFDEV